MIAGEASLRPGLSYGHGFAGKRRSGWIALESFVEYRVSTGRTDFKTDLTIGFNHNDRFKTILQVQGGVSTGDPSFVRLAPSAIIRTGPKTHLEIGLTTGLRGDPETGFKFGFWREF